MCADEASRTCSPLPLLAAEAEFVAAVLEDFGVVVHAGDELLVGGALVADQVKKRILIGVAGFLVV